MNAKRNTLQTPLPAFSETRKTGKMERRSPRNDHLLRERFVSSARPLVTFLNITGVYLFLIPELDNTLGITYCCKWKKWILYAWSGFWLLLNTQSGLYIFARRGLKLVLRILFDSNIMIGGMLTEQLNGALMRVAALVCETLTHFLLVLSIRPTLRRFLTNIEPVYRQIGCPDLSAIRYYSNAFLSFTISVTLFNILCALYWEIYNPYRPFHWLDAIENTIRKINTVFTLIALFLFVICGQLLVILYRKLTQNLQDSASLSKLCKNQKLLWKTLSSYRILSEGSHRLHRDFRSILIANICLSVINILASAYFAITYLYDDFVVTIWDLSDVIEFTFRLWLICHTTDRIHTFAATCVPVLRELRTQSPLITVDRIRITLFIVETAKLSRHGCSGDGYGCRTLFGLISTNKRVMLKSIETIMAFLIIIFQFKNLAIT